jgi:rhodanese-related sulfurtransferase
MTRRTIDELLAAARGRLQRLTPAQAADAVRRGALLVDIRPAAQRAEEGELPGALVIERTVLEWRLDPASPDHVPQIHGYDQHIVVACSQGYSSSLAAATLQEIGLTRATDIDGGVRAWIADGLPVHHQAGDAGPLTV